MFVSISTFGTGVFTAGILPSPLNATVSWKKTHEGSKTLIAVTSNRDGMP
jgi:hypothetical protein